MLRNRVIPCLLMQGGSLVKTIQFKNPTYIGDPINAVKIFNDCEVDELILLDIDATREKRRPDFKLIEKTVDECFMPLAYGGGVRSIEDMEILFQIGIEKISLNALLVEEPDTVRAAVDRFGAQSIVGSLDFKKGLLGGYAPYTRNGAVKLNYTFETYLQHVLSLGVGELLINDIQHDGVMNGYNLELIKRALASSTVPVIAIGGAGKLDDLKAAFNLGVPALAAGSLFVYKSQYRGVLINYPNAVIEEMR